MRLIAIVWSLLASVALASAPEPVPAEPAMGGHGMVLIGGRDGLYASHLPMFHAPHDYQVVARLRFDAPLDAELRAAFAGTPALWTLDPERFDLTRLDPRSHDPLRTFVATVYAGHFERGGEARHRDVRVHVEEVLLFRRLDPAPVVREQLHYVAIGAGSERYLVKLIDSRPDFDHIVALDGVTADVKSLSLPRVDDDVLAALVPTLLGADAHVRGTVYRDAQDLQ